MSQTLLTSCPRDCYDGCGIAVRVEDGRILEVAGNPEHPVSRGTLCGKCTVAYNGVWQDPEARLLHPLRRVGPKGSGRFERASWVEALAAIAERLSEIAARRGPEAILHTHYTGTISLLGFLFPMRFFLRLGAAEVEPDSICNLAGHVAWTTLFGTSAVGFDPRTARDTACVLVWGANPATSAPHMATGWLREQPGRVVVVDPLRTETAARADLHLQPFPGSDAALAFSLLHVLQREGHFDDAFIAAHTLGAQEVMPAIEQATPAWGEAQTGVPAAAIEEAAALYGAGPALLWAGQALQRQPRGANVMRAVGLLPALTGNVGKPGAGFYYLNITPAIAGADLDALAGASLARAAPKKLSHMGLAARLETNDEFEALFCWNTNPAASAPEQARLRRALAREELFTVVVDCFQTDTADLADWVLPAASFLEFDDLTFSYMNLHIGPQQKVAEPMGESLPNTEIFRRLARAMGFEEPELFASDAELIECLLDEMKVGFDFAELARRGHHPISPEPLVFHAERGFETPSGKIEIASTRAEAMGLPRVPEPHADPRPTDGRLRLLSPASAWRLNDSYANDPRLAKRARDASIGLHPEDARRLGIEDGARVRVHNETGSLVLRARLDPHTQPGVAISRKGRWPKLEPTGANLNALHAGHSADVAGATAVHGTEVHIELAGDVP